MFLPDIRVGNNLVRNPLPCLAELLHAPQFQHLFGPPPHPQLPFFSPQFATAHNPGAPMGDGLDGRGESF